MLRSKRLGCWPLALLTAQLLLNGVRDPREALSHANGLLDLLTDIRLQRIAGLNSTVIACRSTTVVSAAAITTKPGSSAIALHTAWPVRADPNLSHRAD